MMKKFKFSEKWKAAIDDKIKNIKPAKRIFMRTNWYSVKFAKTNTKILATGDEEGYISFIDVTKAGEKVNPEDQDFKARVDQYILN